MTLESLALQGRSRMYYSLAASVVPHIYGLRKEFIKETFADTQTAEHKMEVVANVHGIEFINDSRACTVNATWFALESLNRPVIWVTGGVDRGNDYSMIRKLVEDKVRTIICLGEDNTKFLKSFDGLEIPVIRARDMADAVNIGYYLGKKGDVVLLSPACASFNMFENFEQRGVAFKKAVKAL